MQTFQPNLIQLRKETEKEFRFWASIVGDYAGYSIAKYNAKIKYYEMMKRRIELTKGDVKNGNST